MRGLECRNVTAAIGKRVILQDVSLCLAPGKITAIIGPNGSGKSTLLKVLGRILRPQSGNITLGERSLSGVGRRELARCLALLPQDVQSPSDLTVRELAELGRFPHRRWWQPAAAGDRAVVEQALEQAGVLHLAGRLLHTLSGGERRRSWIAMTLAQHAEVLLLDEPTAYLDICHQLEIMQLLAKLNSEQRITVGVVLHDINQAARYAHCIAVIKDGRVVADGCPAEVVTSALLRQVFHVESTVMRTADGPPSVTVTGLARGC